MKVLEKSLDFSSFLRVLSTCDEPVIDLGLQKLGAQVSVEFWAIYLCVNFIQLHTAITAFRFRQRVDVDRVCVDGQNVRDRVLRRRVRLYRGTVPDRSAEYGLGGRIVLRQDRRDRSALHQ